MKKAMERVLLLAFAVFCVISSTGCSNSNNQSETPYYSASSSIESTAESSPILAETTNPTVDDNTAPGTELTSEPPSTEHTAPKPPAAEPTKTICTHSESDWIVDLAPTLKAVGLRHKECTICKQLLAAEKIDYPLETISPCYGFITLQDHTGRYLSVTDHQLTLEATPTAWNLMSCGNDRFYLKESTGFYVLEYFSGVLKMEEDTGYTEQQWILKRNDVGNIVIVHADAQNYYLRSDETGHLSVVHKNNADDYCIWSMQDYGLTQGYPYVEITSQSSIISLRVEHRVFDIISHDRLLNWANNLEQAYMAFAELTGWKPFENVEIRGYTSCSSWGYVYSEKPVVHVNNDELYKDLEKMSKRENDWNFGVLHEMSHLFDKDIWAFEWEALANYKIAYVLYKYDAFAAPAEFPSSQVFSHSTIKDAFFELGGSFTSNNSSIENSLTNKLWEITEVVGWPAVASAFSNFPQSGRNLSNIEKLEQFLLLVQSYSNEDAKSYFSTQEWDILTEALQ